MTTTATTATDTAPGAPPPHPSETIRYLPLSALTLSERNVRTIDDTPAELASLKASILAHGPIQNLAVRPVGNLYEVIAGKRRFRAMRELVDEDEFHPDMMVACRILDKSANDTEISLAENEARVGMHVGDQGTASARLTAAGARCGGGARGRGGGGPGGWGGGGGGLFCVGLLCGLGVVSLLWSALRSC
ncbi:MAG: ParB/Srx family N-terminal domain-containing protein, partial [Acidobacteria bacterium]|nr:ParB/Srx family N-terminal domain-containing protein [Acidobacteriota bacterium]